MELKRWDIINHLIEVNGYKSYLEIGYYKGWSFDRINAPLKECVDPNPSKTPEQQAWDPDSRHVQGPDDHTWAVFYHKMTSDTFFAEAIEAQKWDIIFIDGLHEAKQVARDIKNAVEHLNENGTIVMHDCNPTSYAMVTTGTASGEWTGDTYKAFIDFKYFGPPFYKCCVVDTDYGVGIIQPEPPEYASEMCFDPSDVRGAYSTWELFDVNRRLLLDLITPEQFLKRNETTTDNLLPA